jgi:putative OmpL-like beta-barrel porin-2
MLPPNPKVILYLFFGFVVSAGMCFAEEAQTPQPQAQQPQAPQPQAQQPQAPQPLPTPSMTGPLQSPTPITFDAGPFGKLDLTGIVSGIGVVQGNPVPGDASTRAGLSNGQVFIQRTEGWWQFYLQAGAYTIPALGTPILSTGDTVNDFYGPVPVGYLKLVPTKNLNFLIGQLPTLIGAESTFTFQNMNIERGLLWNQENAINRGIQVNATLGKLTASLSWNDGFFSNRYTWMTGSLAYAFNSANTLSFTAGGNLGQTAFRTLATPVQNNGSIYDVIYTYTKGKWIIQPYFQYTDVPTNRQIGIVQGAATRGGAVLVNYKFNDRLSLAGRAEYISSIGGPQEQAVNLLYGSGSGAWSVTVTPTFQDHAFFIRGEFSFVQATSLTPGDGFGSSGTKRNQPRGAIEAGFIF